MTKLLRYLALVLPFAIAPPAHGTCQLYTGSPKTLTADVVYTSDGKFYWRPTDAWKCNALGHPGGVYPPGCSPGDHAYCPSGCGYRDVAEAVPLMQVLQANMAGYCINPASLTWTAGQYFPSPFFAFDSSLWAASCFNVSSTVTSRVEAFVEGRTEAPWFYFGKISGTGWYVAELDPDWCSSNETGRFSAEFCGDTGTICPEWNGAPHVANAPSGCNPECPAPAQIGNGGGCGSHCFGLSEKPNGLDTWGRVKGIFR